MQDLQELFIQLITTVMEIRAARFRQMPPTKLALMTTTTQRSLSTQERTKVLGFQTIFPERKKSSLKFGARAAVAQTLGGVANTAEAQEVIQKCALPLPLLVKN
jgi:hypothetical protein